MSKASYICGGQNTLILDKTKTKRRLDSKRLSSCKQLRGICDAVIELPLLPLKYTRLRIWETATYRKCFYGINLHENILSFSMRQNMWNVSIYMKYDLKL